MKNILVAYDGSKSSDKALRKAVELFIKLNNGSLAVVSVVADLYLTQLTEADRSRVAKTMTEETGAALEKIRKELAGKSIAVKTVIRQGDPAEKILETAQKMKANLIVTGSHGTHGAKKFLLGSVASKIMDYSKCSVLVVK